jgi:hypothetical protein
MLALEPVIWFRTPDGVVGVLEPVGWSGGRPESAVTAVLRAAGCVGGSPRELRVQHWEDATTCVRHYGFDVDRSRWEETFSATRLLAGGLGGWTEVVVGQTAFHAPSHLVEIMSVIWDRAGRPQWHVAVHVSAKPGGGGETPAELPAFVASDLRARFATSRYMDLEEGSDDSLTAQRTHMEVQKPVEVAAERCEFCGGRLYEADGHYWCASAATIESSPDFEDS